MSFSGDSTTVDVSNDLIDELSDSPRLPTELPFVNVALLLEGGAPIGKEKFIHNEIINEFRDKCYLGQQ